MQTYKFTKSEETMLSRVAIEIAENNVKPNEKNIEATFKKILKRDRETLKRDKDMVLKLLTPVVWSRVKKQEIDKIVSNFIKK